MWTSLPSAFVALTLLSDLTAARLHLQRSHGANADLHLKRSFVGRVESPVDTPSSGVEVGGPVVVVTVTVQPMPVGTYGGVFYSGIATGTGSGIPSGIFPPGPTGSGAGIPLPTGGHGGNTTLSTNSTSEAFPDFTKPPVISIPTGTAFPTTVPTTTRALSSIRTSSVSFPDFTLPPVISVPVPTALPTSTKSSSTSSRLPPASSSRSSTSSSPSPPPSAPIAETPFLRGVNLGGWLVLEKWMNSDAFTGAFSSASDQYTFDSISGSEAALEEHWSTFFTESDISTIAATGINALRIPIGYWAYDNSGTPYKKGADAYLEKAITWARNNKMKVWVDCHGSPGSQNGFDNSGAAGSVNWQQKANLEKSIQVLKIMAAKYGKAKYADVVVGLELVNEPISWGNNNFETTKSWAQEAYASVRAVVENPNLQIITHDAFQGGVAWNSIGSALHSASRQTKNAFGVDEHLYQLFTDAYNAMDQSQHITAACGWADGLAASNAVMPTYVGEWSPATNICVNPDGSTTAGTSCSVDGCQCQVDDFGKWNDAMIAQTRRFVEAQLDVFESSTSGYFMWAAKGPGGWGFLNGIEQGIIPNPVTERKFPGQCGGNSKRRDVRGAMGSRETF